MSKSDINPAYANKGDLTKGPISNHLIRLTLPMVWGIFALISFQLVDTFYISLLGAPELAAISFTFPVTYTIFTLIMGLTISMSSVVSRQIGEGNTDRVKRITTHGLILAFVTGIILAILGYALLDPIFRAMGADEEMLAMIREYMVVWLFGNLFFTIPIVGNAAIRAGGDSFTPAIIMTVVAVVNVILDPILIFGLFGFPEMGLRGAALATVIANFCAMVAGLYVLYVRKNMICRDGLHLNHFKDSAKRLAFIALPAGLTGTIQPVTAAVIIALLAGYGTEAVAAFGVAGRIEAFACTIIMALSTGMAPVIGQNWGARRFDRVQATLSRAFSFAVLWSLLVAAVFIVFARPLAGLFAPDASPQFIHITALYFWIVALTYAPGNLVPGWSSAFNAIGMPKHSFMMIVVKMLVMQLPLALLGGHYFGIIGIFGAIAVTNVVSGIGFHLLNRKTYARAQRQKEAAH